jgi:NADPH-dependent curcumin reductase CurA
MFSAAVNALAPRGRLVIIGMMSAYQVCDPAFSVIQTVWA